MRIGIGIGVEFGKVLSSFSPEALAWKGWIEANGGTIPNATLAIIDENLITPLVAAGEWAKMDRFNWYYGIASHEIAARTNMIKNAHYITPISSPIFDADGYRSAGAGSYLNLNYNPQSQGVNFVRNSCCIFTVIKNPTYIVTRRMIGSDTFSPSVNRSSLIRQSFGIEGFISQSVGSSEQYETPTGNVLFGIKRTSSTAVSIQTNTTKVATSRASVALLSQSTFELTTSVDGTPSSDVDIRSHICSGHGSGDVDMDVWLTAINNTIAAL